VDGFVCAEFIRSMTSEWQKRRRFECGRRVGGGIRLRTTGSRDGEWVLIVEIDFLMARASSWVVINSYGISIFGTVSKNSKTMSKI
jgi:hypothetical protein